MSEIVRVSWEDGMTGHTTIRYAADFYPLTPDGDDVEDYAEGFAAWLRAAHCNGGRGLSRVTVYRLNDGLEEIA